jgi:membrane protease YdiL (CAAX protease family)
MHGIAAILLAPFVEEVVFRGILYPSIKQSGFHRLALWGTSFFFALTHSNLMILLPLTLLAIVLTLLYETTNNLIAPIVTHSLFNAANYAYLLFQKYQQGLL